MSSFMEFGSRWISLAERSRSSFALFYLYYVYVSLSLSLCVCDAVGGHQW
jgi:hypothetical protein